MSSPTSSRDQIALSVTLRATPARVWHALTDGRASWWPDLRFEATPGAPLTETWHDDAGSPQEANGTVTLVEPGRLLSFVWQELGWRGALRVTFHLSKAQEGTQLHLTESGFLQLDGADTLRDEHTFGWMYHLGRLGQATRLRMAS